LIILKKMKCTKNLLLIFIAAAACQLIPCLSNGQDTGYKDYKDLGKDYLSCVLKNDTVTLAAKIINKQFLMTMTACGNKDGDLNSGSIDSLIKNNYPKLFHYYLESFNRLRKKMVQNTISDAKIDSIILEKKPVSDLPCKELTDYNLNVYISSNGKGYGISLEVTEYQKLWNVADIQRWLDGPYGYVQSWQGGKLIEEHKVSK
jgi:hypothetical protein